MRGPEVSSDCGVADLADGPAFEITFDAEHHITHLVVIASQNSTAHTVLAGRGRNYERRSEQDRTGGVFGVCAYPTEFTSDIKTRPRERRRIGDRRNRLNRGGQIGRAGRILIKIAEVDAKRQGSNGTWLASLV